MAYTMVRIPVWSIGDPFKINQDDHELKTRTYPALDDYLSTMESRGWSIVTVTSSPDGFSVFVTFHRDEGPDPSPTHTPG